jgi:hypothetical protein
MKTVREYAAKKVHPEAKKQRENWRDTKVEQIARVVENFSPPTYAPPARVIQRVVLWRRGLAICGETLEEAARKDLYERIDHYQSLMENCPPADWPALDLQHHVAAGGTGEILLLTAPDTEGGREALEDIVEKLQIA